MTPIEVVIDNEMLELKKRVAWALGLDCYTSGDSVFFIDHTGCTLIDEELPIHCGKTEKEAWKLFPNFAIKLIQKED